MAPGTVLLILGVLGSVGGWAQAQKPNFSGTWLLVAPPDVAIQPPGQEETITQTQASIVFGHPSEGGGHRTTYSLDGREVGNSIAGNRFVTRASWDGPRLILIDRETTKTGASETMKILHIDENGSLVMEMKPPIQTGPGGLAVSTLVFRKR